MSLSRQPDRGAADRVVERGRRLGRPRGRLYPAGERHRARGSAARSACAAATCALLVGCGAAGAIAGAFGAPLAGAFYAFELIIGSYSVAEPRAGRHRGAGRLPGGAAVRAALARHRCRSMCRRSTRPRSRDRERASALVAARRRRRAHARRRAVRGSCSSGCSVPTAAAGARRARGRRAGARRRRRCCRPATARSTRRHDATSRCATSRCCSCSRRSPRSCRSAPASAAACSSPRCCSARSAGGCSRTALNVAWPALALDPARLCHHRHGRAVGLGHRRAADHDLHRARDHRRSLAHHRGADRRDRRRRRSRARSFGYSFATWRFHLRGETIRSAADVGWIRDLTVGRMMRPDVRTVPARHHASTRSARRFRSARPRQVVAVDETRHYAGIVDRGGGARARTLDERPAGRDDPAPPDTVLLPTMTVQEAVAAFDRAEAEALAVVDSRGARQVIGLLTRGARAAPLRRGVRAAPARAAGER